MFAPSRGYTVAAVVAYRITAKRRQINMFFLSALTILTTRNTHRQYLFLLKSETSSCIDALYVVFKQYTSEQHGNAHTWRLYRLLN